MGNHRKPVQLESWGEEQAIMADYIRKHANDREHLNILEAGCGLKWGFDIKDVDFTLTGLDNDKDALEIRKNRQKDLDIAILGDLSTVILQDNSYDVIFSSYVIEHIDGAEQVMEKFISWLKPNGILILRIPNRNSVKGFLTRVTPFWIHVLHKRYFEGFKDAGKPGHDPFPTFLDRVVSRKGIWEFCMKHHLKINGEFSGGRGRKKHRIRWILTWILSWLICFLSGGTLTAKHAEMIYIIQKPDESEQLTPAKLGSSG